MSDESKIPPDPRARCAKCHQVMPVGDCAVLITGLVLENGNFKVNFTSAHYQVVKADGSSMCRPDDWPALGAKERGVARGI